MNGFPWSESVVFLIMSQKWSELNTKVQHKYCPFTSKMYAGYDRNQYHNLVIFQMFFSQQSDTCMQYLAT